jgi:predicted 3-demethylubiquinone-9 3-methyltransferase (glyoxalase superfamily)
MMEAEDYTFAEMVDIHFFYGRGNGNAHEARRLYQETFPNPRLPCSRTFSRIAQSLRETDVLRQMVSTLNILCNTQTGTST